MQVNPIANRYYLAESKASELSQNILFPYAWDEWMCRQLTIESPNYIHIWQHPRAFVLGLRDRQLPNVKQAIQWLENQGYSVAVRNSGGAAVPLDAGVVNLSLVLPKLYGSLNFRDDFETMILLLRESLLPWTSLIEQGEIAGGYCPGDYDLSIKGQKFCGIAQRRQANGFVVSAFVNVSGDSIERAKMVRSFYDIASGEAEGSRHPIVEAESMSSLQALAGVPSVDAFIGSLKGSTSIIAAESQSEQFRSNKKLFPEDLLAQVMHQLKERYSST